MSEGREQEARAVLTRAVELEPQALHVQLALAEALTMRGGDLDAAQAAAREAARLAAGLDGEAGDDARLRTAILAAEASSDSLLAAELLTELLRRHPERTELALDAAGAYSDAGRREEARQILDELRARWPDEDPRELYRRAYVLDSEGSYEAALAAARAAIRRGRELGLRSIVVQARRYEFMALRSLDRGDEAAAAAEAAVVLAEEIGRAELLSNALRWRGVALYDAGDADGAEAAYRRSLELARAAGDQASEAWCLNNLGVLAMYRGDLAAAADFYQQAIVLMRLLYRQDFILTLRSNLSELWFFQGRLEEVEQECREVFAAAQAGADPSLQALVVERLAQVALERGELGRAGSHLDQVEGLARRGERSSLPRVLALRSRLHRLLDEPQAARRTALEAVAAASGGDNGENLTLALAARGDVEIAEGRAAAAVGTFREARGHARRISHQVFEANVERSLGRAWLADGDTAAARRHLETALADHQRLGCELEVAHDRVALAELSAAEGDSRGAAALADVAQRTYRRLGAAEGAAATVAAALLARHGGPVAVAAAAGGSAP